MKKWFSLALVLAICFTTVMGDFSLAYADDFDIDEVITEPVDTVVTMAAADSASANPDDGIGLSLDGTSDWDEYALDEADDDPVVTADQVDVEALSDLSLDDELDLDEGITSNADESIPSVEDSTDTMWYARARISLTLNVEDGLGRTIPAGSILLVTESAGDGLVHVACVNLTGVVDDSALEPMTDEEIAAFMDEIAQTDDVILYNDNIDYPLPPEPVDPNVETQTPSEDLPAENNLDSADRQSDQGENGDEQTEVADGAPADSGAAEEDDNKASPDDESAEDPESAGESENTGNTESGEDSEATDPKEASESGEASEPKEDSEDTEGNEEGEEDETVQDGTETSEKVMAAEEAGVPKSISVNLKSIYLGVKETFTGLTATVVDAGGKAVSGKTVTWASSNNRVVKVDGNGKLTAVRRGTATIVITSSGLPQASVSIVVKKAPSKVTVKPKKKNIGIGMKLSLTAKLSKGSASGKLTYTSGNPGVAQVSAGGVVTGVGPGKATIYVRTYNGKRASCKVYVFGKPASIQTNKASYSMVYGATEKMVVNVKTSGGTKTYANLTFTSSNPKIVSVDGNGKLAGVGYGTATVTITTHNGVSVQRTVNVCAAPADLALNAYTITIGVREKYTRMSYTLVPPKGQTKCLGTVTWKSRNKRIAKVNSKTGVITGVRAGTTTIVAKTNNKITKKLKVIVQKKPKSVQISPKTLALTAGMSRTVSASYNGKSKTVNVTYTSSNPNVAKVDQNGKVTAVAYGTANITARTYNGKTDTCKVTVYNLPAQVTMTQSIVLAVGMTGQMKCSVVDAKGQPSIADYSFSAVSETGSVQVDSSGNVTAKSVGTARVKVSTQNGVTTHLDVNGEPVETECVVTIVEAPSEIRLDTSSLELTVGSSHTFKPTMYTPDGNATSIGTYKLTVSGSGVSVSGNTIKGVGAADVVVTATTYNGHTATCKVKFTRRYRMFAVYDFYNVSAKGSLTFPMNNATSFQTTFAKSSIAGIKYENLGLLKNPTKDAMLSGIKKAFADSRATDVSLIYLVSHGTNKVDIPKSKNYTHYGLQLPGYTNYKCSSNYYVTSEDIYNAISSIKGQVILVLDSCYSGQFITNMKSALDKAGGRISVMTAATNTTACYYNIANTSTACDFFTMYLLLGAGYNMRTHQNSGSYPADANKDGKLTFNELFNYAKSNVKSNVPKYKNKSWFHGNYKQSPNVYKGSNGDLVLFQYK